MSADAPIPATERLHPRGEQLHLASPRQLALMMAEEGRQAAAALERCADAVARGITRWEETCRAGGRVILLGSGTSGRLAVLEAAECPPTFSTSPEQVMALMAGGSQAFIEAQEGAEDSRRDGRQELAARQVGERDLVIGITASGTTPYVLAALEAAREMGAGTILLTCAEPPVIVPWDVIIALDTGPELLQGSTRLKAGTATKMVLNALSTGAFARLGKVYLGRMVDVKVSNDKLRRRACRIVSELTGLEPEDSQRLLQRADGRVKTAIAMHHREVGRQEAERLLAETGGDLAPLLQPVEADEFVEEGEQGEEESGVLGKPPTELFPD